jgi:hypothetical protein
MSSRPCAGGNSATMPRWSPCSRSGPGAWPLPPRWLAHALHSHCEVLRSNAEGFRVAWRQIVTEVSALEFVGEVAPGITPSLIAQDVDPNVPVTEDFAPRRTLHSLVSTEITIPEPEQAFTHSRRTGLVSTPPPHAVSAAWPWDDGARGWYSGATSCTAPGARSGSAATSTPPRSSIRTWPGTPGCSSVSPCRRRPGAARVGR